VSYQEKTEKTGRFLV